MQENQIAGKGFEEIIFLDYKDELVNEVNKLRKENKVNAVILLSHIPINCRIIDNLTFNLYKPSDEQESCEREADLYKLINSLEKGIIDSIITGHSHREVHHWANDIQIISPIGNGLYANILYLAFRKKKNYNFEPKEIRIGSPLPICEKILKNIINENL